MCKEIIFKKTTIINKVNQILKDNFFEEIDEHDFMKSLKKVNLYANYTVSLISDTSKVKELLTESRWQGTEVLYKEILPMYPMTPAKKYALSLVPRYEFINEDVFIIYGYAKKGYIKYDDKRRVKDYCRPDFDISRPLVFINTNISHTKYYYRNKFNQTVYVYIPKISDQ